MRRIIIAGVSSLALAALAGCSGGGMDWGSSGSSGMTGSGATGASASTQTTGSGEGEYWAPSATNQGYPSGTRSTVDSSPGFSGTSDASGGGSHSSGSIPYGGVANTGSGTSQ